MKKAYTLALIILTGCTAKRPIGPDAGVSPTLNSSLIPCGEPIVVLAVITDPMCENCIKPEPHLKMKPTARGYQCMAGKACDKLHPVGKEYTHDEIEAARKFCFNYEEGKS